MVRQNSIIAERKRKIEEKVAKKTMATWIKVQELKFWREVGFSHHGAGVTNKFMTREVKYQRRLDDSRPVDFFSNEGVQLLMLLKEQKVLKRTACSDEFLRTSTGGITAWLAVWRISVDKEIELVRSKIYE